MDVWTTGLLDSGIFLPSTSISTSGPIWERAGIDNSQIWKLQLGLKSGSFRRCNQFLVSINQLFLFPLGSHVDYPVFFFFGRTITLLEAYAIAGFLPTGTPMKDIGRP